MPLEIRGAHFLIRSAQSNTLRIGPVTDRGNRLPRPQALDSAAAAGLGRATPHASPRLFAADDVTTETYYHGHD